MNVSVYGCNFEENFNFLDLSLARGKHVTEFSGPSGNLTSPEWPRAYSNFADSYLKINCNGGEKVYLEFETLDIQFSPSCQ